MRRYSILLTAAVVTAACARSNSAARDSTAAVAAADTIASNLTRAVTGSDTIARKPTGAVAASDTLVGVVNEVGADPATWLALQPRAGGSSIRLDGAGAAGLRGVSGAEVWVSGASQADGFRVDEFEVRRVNGQPVDDGVVRVESGKVMIRMRSGAQRDVPNAPPALRDMVGARVWISPAVADRAPSYGVIRRP